MAGGSAGPAWSLTGETFNAGGPQAVCRFYGSEAPGPNSHFYTIDSDECDWLKRLQANASVAIQRWNFESYDFRSMPAVDGQCGPDAEPVYSVVEPAHPLAMGERLRTGDPVRHHPRPRHAPFLVRENRMPSVRDSIGVRPCAPRGSAGSMISQIGWPSFTLAPAARDR